MSQKDNTERKDIVEHSLALYTQELVDSLMDGWAISPNVRPEVVGLYGGTYTASLYRNADTVTAFREKLNTVAEVRKPSRAEILAKARAAKKQKAQENNT